VHVGRGAQLVNEDLLAALQQGQLAEAVLDVTDPEPLPQDHALWSHPNIRITPHIGWTNDFSWNVINGPRNDFGMVRTGLTFAF